MSNVFTCTSNILIHMSTILCAIDAHNMGTYIRRRVRDVYLECARFKMASPILMYKRASADGGGKEQFKAMNRLLWMY